MMTVALILILLTSSSSVGCPPASVASAVAGQEADIYSASVASAVAGQEADIYSRISEINRNVKGLTEGDIKVTTSRNARICNQCNWKKGSDNVEVPYVMDSSYTSEQRDMIHDAMDTFHEKTCIRFVLRSKQFDNLNIVNTGGCSSYVGRTGGEQNLSLQHFSANRTCFASGVIQHELIHALGFYHEQTRSDRDHYVRINWENIETGKENNFKKHETNNLNTTYDYSSVMHYGRKDFSGNGRDTITPIKDPTAEIGQREGMTDTDILKINRLYCTLSSAHLVSSLSVTLLCLLASLM